MLRPAARGEALSLSYGTHVALQPSTFEVPTGSVTAVIGPNGSGKSTVLNALAGVIEPRSGSLEVLGSTSRPPRGVAYVMQTVQLPEGTPITVREVVTMARYSTLGWWRPVGREDRRRVAEAMERLGVSRLAGRHLSELSGGQRQRVYVAQGIAQDHDLLLLDEPLTGLDIVSARAIDGIVHAERDRGRSVVLTTHDLDEARAADHVILVNGVVVASGPPESVLTRPNLEIAYGLGVLHHAADQVIDDPGHTPVHRPGRSAHE